MHLSNLEKERFYHGRMFDAYKFFGCQYNSKTKSAVFRVFAPRAAAVSVVGDFNNWDTSKDVCYCDGGIWSAEVSGLDTLTNYKFYIATNDGRALYKSDPFAFHAEHTEKNSKAYDISKFKWTDGDFIAQRTSHYDKPVNIYEAHIGSWKQYDDGNFFSYKKFADEICPYLKKIGYTHIKYWFYCTTIC